jgi:hypothetical protein
MSRAIELATAEKIGVFLRNALSAGGLEAPAVERAVAALGPKLKRIVVYRDAQARGAAKPVRGAAASPASAPPAPAQPPVASAPAPAAAPFDPFAFSAVVVLTKTGPEGLMQRLAEVGPVEHLRQLAEAQHLAVDPAQLDSADEWRRAIVEAAAQRIANRRAAAS